MSLGAVLDHFANRPQQHVIALNTFFFKPTKGGAFVVEIRELKPSKFGYCVLEVTFQQPKVKSSMLCCFFKLVAHVISIGSYCTSANTCERV